MIKMPDVEFVVPKAACHELIDGFMRGLQVKLTCHVMSIIPRGEDKAVVTLRPTGAPRVKCDGNHAGRCLDLECWNQ